jgi:hypothetical protein
VSGRVASQIHPPDPLSDVANYRREQRTSALNNGFDALGKRGCAAMGGLLE